MHNFDTLKQMKMSCTPLIVIEEPFDENFSTLYYHDSPEYLYNYSYNNTFEFVNRPNTLEDIEMFLYRWIILFIVIFGIAGNCVNLTVLTSKSLSKSMGRMEMSAHIGLVTLAISDMIFCIVVMPKSFSSLNSPTISDSITFIFLYKTYGDAVINTFETSSTWLTVSMAFSRYMAICHPFKARRFVGKTFAKVNILIVFLTSVAFNLPRFFTHMISSVECIEGYNMYVILPYMRPGVMHIYLWCHFIVCIVLPFVIMAFCNCFLIKEVRSAPTKIQRQTTREKKRDNSTYLLTLTLTLIVVFYILLVTPAEFNNFVAHMVEIKSDEIRSYLNFSVAVTNTMKTLNFAVNFILYCAVNAQFRKAIRETLCCASKKNVNRTASLQQTEYSRITTSDRNVHLLTDRTRNSSCV